MVPDYGANVENLLFEPLTVSFAKRMSVDIERAILFHEPRITTDNVSFRQDTENGLVELKIDYTIIATNSRRNCLSILQKRRYRPIPIALENGNQL